MHLQRRLATKMAHELYKGLELSPAAAMNHVLAMDPSVIRADT